jgi:V/A-type H+-transporting ATPase subunit C
MTSLKSDYAYPYPRIMASKGYLLRDEDLRALTAVDQLEEYVAFLERTHYGVGRTIGLDLGNIESMLLSDLVSAGKMVLDFAPGRTRSFFESLMLKHEIELIKLVLNRFDGATGGEKNIDQSVYYPALSSDIERAMELLNVVKTKTEALDVLKGTRYGFLSGLPAEELTPEKVAALLDRYYFQELWNSVEGLSAEDAKYARRLVGTEIELINIMALFRSAVHGYDAKKFIIPISYKLGNMVNILTGVDLHGIVSALSDTPYGEAVSDGFKHYEGDKSLLKLEMNFKRYLLRENKKLFLGYPFHIGIMLGFLKLKEYEVNNLISILVGIEYDLPAEERESLLIS